MSKLQGTTRAIEIANVFVPVYIEYFDKRLRVSLTFDSSLHLFYTSDTNRESTVNIT